MDGLASLVLHSRLDQKTRKTLNRFIITLKEKKQEVDVLNNNQKFSFWRLVKKGFFMNVLNLKVFLFFIAFLPQFISESGFNITFQMIFLGIIFMIQALLIFVLISKLSGKLSKYLKNQKFWKITKYGKATVLGALGAALAFSKKQ